MRRCTRTRASHRRSARSAPAATRRAWLPWNAPADLRQGIEDNLRALDVEQLAAVNLRLLDGGTGTNGLAEQLDAMMRARADGLIGGIGLSNCNVEQLRFALARTELVCVHNSFSYVDRSSQEVLDLCAERGIAFVPFFPLGSGFGVADVRGNPAIVAAAKQLGASPAQVALAWTLQQSANVLVIRGTSSLAHLAENFAAARASATC